MLKVCILQDWVHGEPHVFVLGMVFVSLPSPQEWFDLGGHFKVLSVNAGYRTGSEQQANIIEYFQACNLLAYTYSGKANNGFLFDNF